jgi:Spy/CpxP family protein refolding chaperone
MRKVLKGALVLGLALGMASVAQAQRQRPGGFGGGAFLLQNEGVQKELNITDEQKTKLKEAMEKVRDANKDIIDKGREMTREDREKLAKASNEAIGKVLDEKQVKRFKEIQLQTQGAAALQNPDVQSKLKLSDDQKDKIKKINEESREKMRDLFGGGFNEETQKKMAELRKETLEKASGVLTAEQKKTWKEMTGKPFEVRFGRRRST